MSILARAATLLPILLLALVVGGCGSYADDDGATGEPRDAGSESTGPTGALDDAQAIELRAAVKQYTTTIEACAAQNLDGTYTGCLDQAKLFEEDPTLESVTGDATVGPASDPTMSYAVAIAGDGMTFAETHEGDGTITRSCTPVEAPGCTDGTW